MDQDQNDDLGVVHLVILGSDETYTFDDAAALVVFLDERFPQKGGVIEKDGHYVVVVDGAEVAYFQGTLPLDQAN